MGILCVSTSIAISCINYNKFRIYNIILLSIAGSMCITIPLVWLFGDYFKILNEYNVTYYDENNPDVGGQSTPAILGKSCIIAIAATFGYFLCVSILVSQLLQNDNLIQISSKKRMLIRVISCIIPVILCCFVLYLDEYVKFKKDRNYNILRWNGWDELSECIHYYQLTNGWDEWINTNNDLRQPLVDGSKMNGMFCAVMGVIGIVCGLIGILISLMVKSESNISVRITALNMIVLVVGNTVCAMIPCVWLLRGYLGEM